MSAAPAPLPWLRHARDILTLAVPVMVARAGVLVLVTVDTVMTGQVGAEALAAYAVASAVQIPMLLFGIGLLSGTTVFAAQAAAVGNLREAGSVWRVALRQALLYGAAMALICWLGGSTLLVWLGQPAPLAQSGGRVLAWLGAGVPAALAFTATSFYLESRGHAGVGVLVMAAANLLNAALNWVLIYGNLGAPPLGAEGAALGTSLARWFTVGATLVYVRWRLDARGEGLVGPVAQAAALSSRLWRFGLPMGLSHAMESGAFACMTLFAGLMGAAVVAAYQVAMNLVALAFMLALGFCTAASVHVASAVGRASPVDVVRAGVTATVLAATALGAIGLGYGHAATALAQVYSGDPRLVALAAPTIGVVAWLLVPDGVQGTLMGALRGCRDVWPATGLYLLSFWGVMVPAGYLLGVRGSGGPVALMQATLIGVLVASLLLGWRFVVVARRAAGASAAASPGAAA